MGLYINGVYVAEGQAAMGTLLDIDNVEIVRGTQGTLFGRNNTGGSVSIHTRAPQLDSYSGEFALAGGNDGLFGARAIVNVPLASTLAVRFAYQDNQHQGWGSSIVTGQNNFMDQHRYQARGSLLWQPGAGLQCRDHLRALPRQRGRRAAAPAARDTRRACFRGTRCRRTSTRPMPASSRATSPSPTPGA